MIRKTNRTRNVVALAAATVLAFGVTGCAGGSGGGGEAGEEGPISITVGLPVPANTLAPVYVAQAEGFLEDAGLDAEVVSFQGDADLVKAVLGGTVDVAVASLSGVITAANSGQDVKVFYGGFNMPAFSFYATEGVESVEDGAGKNWGVTTFGSSTDLITRYALSEAGLDPDKDAEIVQAGPSSARLAAMKAGSLDVNIFADPVTFQAERDGYKKILDLRDVVEDYPMHVAWGRGDFVKENPEVAERFVEALSNSMEFTKENPEEAAKIMAVETKFEEEDAIRSVENYLDYLYPDGRMVSDEGLDAFFDMSISGGLFDKRPETSEWLDTEFLPQD